MEVKQEVSKESSKEPLQIALVALSGRGKTMSFRNCDPDTFGFINAEGKPLPFPNRFKNYSKPRTWQDMIKIFVEYAKDPKIEAVGFDSLSAFLDSLFEYANANRSGYEIYNFYNAEVGKFLNLIKRFPKTLFVTAHYEATENVDGVLETHIKTKGKEFKCQIEREFTCVMFADVKMLPEDKREYFFTLNSDGRTSAKTPPYLFGEVNKIPNDVNLIIKTIQEKQ